MEYTKRRNLNRGYMKLEVWHRGMDLFTLASRLAGQVADFKLKSQFADAAQSVSANIAEGYGRRTLSDYLYFLYVTKGSLGEALTRAIGLRQAQLLNAAEFEQFDSLQYEVENKLLALITALETKRVTGHWVDSLPSHTTPPGAQDNPFQPRPSTQSTRAAATPTPIHLSNNPAIHQSINPTIH